MDNLKARVSNSPYDRITKESMKPAVTSKLSKFWNIVTEKSDIQFASISALT